MTARRLLLVVAASAVLMTAGGPATPASAEGVYSGACTIELDVTPSTTVGTLPAQMTLHGEGGGDCLTNEGAAWMDLTITVTTHPALVGISCAGGFAAGSGFVELDLPGFTGLPLEVTVVVSGSSVSLVATAEVTRFDGLGLLTREPTGKGTCPAGGPTPITWSGPFGFQDPEPPSLT